jgi:hypothetical protein
MTDNDLKKQTPYEYYNYFKEYLWSLLKRTFNINDVLVFVTYQPRQITYLPNEVREQTKQLFGAFPYVEVIEQTYEKKKTKRYGKFVGSYHSHILIRKSDYETIEHQLRHLDIVAEKVYNFDRLKEWYLVKQAGQTPDRILPTQNIPIPLPQLIEETTTVQVIKKTVLKLKQVVNLVIKILHYAQISSEIRINKIKVALMYVNDT